MAANPVISGYRGQVLIGAAGSAGTTQITNSDADIKVDYEQGTDDSTTRGAGTSPPIETVGIVSIKINSVEFSCKVRQTDANVETLMAALAAGNGLAFRTKHHSSGKGFDGDGYFKASLGQPLKGMSVLTVTVTPTDDYGRTPSLWS